MIMKKLNLDEIIPLVHGASEVCEKDGKISLFRFTKEQRELYKTVSRDYYRKCFATAGITLEFDTDSENLTLSVSVNPGSSRRFFTHSVFVNGKRTGELSGDIGEKENVFYTEAFTLGGGIKRIKIQFPWSVSSDILSLEIDDNAKITPVVKKRNILMFGDSITQGYDAVYPENAYAVKLADAAGAEIRDKAIAGERFFAELAKNKENFRPDIITVAYGTNDWCHSAKEEFETQCRSFFYNLRNSYPEAEIIAFTPVWRADIEDKKPISQPFGFISEYIKKVAENIPDIKVFDGIDFIPHDLRCYSPDGLHPNDAGFEHYGNAVLNIIKNIPRY